MQQTATERPIVIAIDGTSASGKSTNSKLVAKALGFIHVDTGAMYRALAWYCLKQNVDVTDPKVMEGRDIGTNVFPETDFKYYLDAHLEERSRRRAAEGVEENLAARDQRDSQRAVAPLMIALGAKVINNSQLTSAQTSGIIIEDIRKRLAERIEPLGAKSK